MFTVRRNRPVSPSHSHGEFKLISLSKTLISKTLSLINPSGLSNQGVVIWLTSAPCKIISFSALRIGGDKVKVNVNVHDKKLFPIDIEIEKENEWIKKEVKYNKNLNVNEDVKVTIESGSPIQVLFQVDFERF
jgi:hypothetical protein